MRTSCGRTCLSFTRTGVRVVILTGAGRAFSAGVDLTSAAGSTYDRAAVGGGKMVLIAHDVHAWQCFKVLTTWKPLSRHWSSSLVLPLEL